MQQMLKGNYSFFTYWMLVFERNAEHPLIAPWPSACRSAAAGDSWSGTPRTSTARPWSG